MATVTRQPRDPAAWQALLEWYEQGLADLDAGKHSVGCQCQYASNKYGEDTDDQPNACLAIVRALLKLEPYTIEETK